MAAERLVTSKEFSKHTAKATKSREVPALANLLSNVDGQAACASGSNVCLINELPVVPRCAQLLWPA